MSNVLSITGLNAAKTAQVSKELQTLLADLQVHYTNLRGIHWHITGIQFFSLHKKFEDLYDDTADKVDEVAERLLQLGVSPENRFSVLLSQSEIKETTGISKAADAANYFLTTLATLIAREKAVLAAAEEVGDTVTVDLVSGFLNEQEKAAWMFSAYTAQ